MDTSLTICLYVLLISTVVGNLARCGDVESDRRTQQARSDAANVVLFFAGITLIGAWIWLALMTGWWQIAAMTLAAYFIRLAAQMASRR